MKYVRLVSNLVTEIIPEYALPVEKWYGSKFASECIEAPDEIQQGWVFNETTKTFSEPPISPIIQHIPTNEELATDNKLLRAQIKATTERNDFVEECLAEMAIKIYV